MKKILALLLAFTCMFCLAGCAGDAAQGEATATPAETTPTPTPTPTPIPTLEYDPLTGGETAYPGSRPVAVTYAEDSDARPLWGVAQAELLIEGQVKGQFSTLTAVFPNSEDLPKVGPVGYGQDLSLQFVLPLNAIPVHMGKSVYASNLVNLLTYQDLDGLLAGTSLLAFDQERSDLGRPDSLCWYTDRGLVASALELYGTSAQGPLVSLFTFGTPQEGTQPAAQFEMLYSQYSSTRGTYDAESGKYLLSYGDGTPWTDPNLDKVAGVENVVILMSSAQPKDDGVTWDYDLTQGDAYLLHKGTALPCRWVKTNATAPLELVDQKGDPIPVASGRTYIGIYGGLENQSVTFS